ncbi:MAG: hypothetical protein JNK67_00320 [Alphaproteobacteria bacterium]|nr:hypothetical protein [Alphaproteobacteria bacterium]
MNRPDIAAAVLAGNALLALACVGLAQALGRWTRVQGINRHLRQVSITFVGLAGAFTLGAAVAWWRT